MKIQVILLACFALLVSCTQPNSDGLNVTPETIPTALPVSQPLPPPTRARDCGWGAEVRAWIDENSDGIWDPNELPLENVAFFVDDTYNRLKNVSDYAVSDATGKSELYVWLPGCPTVAFEIYAEAPASYIPTTPIRITPPLRGGSILRFGFQYAENAVATPRPQASLDCHLVIRSPGTLFKRGIAAMAISPDAAIWVAYADKDIVRIDTLSEYSTTFSIKGIYEYVRVDTISFSPDNTVWIGTSRDAIQLDGSKWVTYTTTAQPGMMNSEIRDIAFAPDATVWFTHLLGPVTRFNPKTNTWNMEAIPESWLTSNHGIDSIRVAPDGTLWFFSSQSIYQYTSPTVPNAKQNWIIHKRDSADMGEEVRNLNTKASIVVSNELMWLVGTTDAGPSIVRYNPLKREWITINHRTTKGVMPGGKISSLAIAKDKSLWVGLSERGVAHFIPGTLDVLNGTWLHYTQANGLLGTSILWTLVDPAGYVWLADDSNQVIRCSEKKP